ncbi:MAG TPA: CehA/McbA family metallohydrolase [Nocardioidaceae bacterium]|nr:CehA/McbA family metallohydrolase [Nocardioidaceae bacterium]
MCDDHGRPHGLERRTFLGAAASSLLLAGLPRPALAAARDSLAAPVTGAQRASRISSGTTLVHADLHNHTLISDGDGSPEDAFVSMRAAGLDVAALTDHATLSDHLLGDQVKAAMPAGYSQLGGLTREGWERTRVLADGADRPGVFTAMRGFEWSEPTLGHVNVWFTDEWTDVVDLGQMGPLYRWLERQSGLLGLGDGGAEGIAGFNHPGREPGRFEEFRFDPAVRDQMVSREMFNRRDDYLFEGYADGHPSPLCVCLNAGWRTGITGVTDEHGTDWGFPEGKGRTGLWVEEHSRAGVLAAMRARRFFATRTSGLRVDATAAYDDGRPAVRMGGVLPVGEGLVTFTLDLERDDSWIGRTLHAQVLRPGTEAPEVVDVVPFVVGDVVRFAVPLDAADGDWVLLRISDPAQANATPGPAGHPCNDLGIAYTSPWWLEPGS